MLHVAAAEELLQLHGEMKSWVGVPRTVRTALTPEATVKHAEKMLPKDFRMRIFWPKDGHHGAMYLCHQGHVDLADISSGGTALLCICLLQSCGYCRCRMPAMFCVCAPGAPKRYPDSWACALYHLLQPSPALPCQVSLFVGTVVVILTSCASSGCMNKGDRYYRPISKCTDATIHLLTKLFIPSMQC